MAGECTLLYELEVPIPFTCDNATGIEKGALLILTDPYTVATTTGDTDEIIGIAAEEKIALDGKTTIPVYLRGVFIGLAGAAGVIAGMAIISDTGTGAANDLVIADTNSEHLVGMALETASSDETFRFLLNPLGIQLA